MTTLDSLLETVENHKGIEEETKAKNANKDLYDVLTFDNTDVHKKQGYELPYSNGQKRTFSFE